MVAEVEMRRLDRRTEKREEELLATRARVVAIIDERQREGEMRVLEIRQSVDSEGFGKCLFAFSRIPFIIMAFLFFYFYG